MAKAQATPYNARAAWARNLATPVASGVSGTPSFFVNGRRHQGAYDVETLTAAVRAARGRAHLSVTVLT